MKSLTKLSPIASDLRMLNGSPDGQGEVLVVAMCIFGQESFCWGF
jgi:hypothetical protein